MCRGCCGWIPKSWWDKGNDGQCCRCCVGWTMFIIILFGLITTMIVLLILTVNKKVEQDEFAVFINSFTTDVSDVYTQGTYTLAVGDEITTFKRTYQHLDFDDLPCMSYDQLELAVTISLQYKYTQDHVVPTILKKFDNEDNFKGFFVDKIVSNIITVCGNYSAEDYYSKRGTIEVEMYDTVVADINASDVGLEIIFLQLKNIDFPKKFAEAITKKQLAQQEAVTQLNNRTSQMIVANTALIAAQQQAQIIVINANNTANINIKQALNEELIIMNQWAQRTLGFNVTITNLNLSPRQFVKYLEYDLLRSTQSPIIRLS